jgi:hypothetical protein
VLTQTDRKNRGERSLRGVGQCAHCSARPFRPRRNRVEVPDLAHAQFLYGWREVCSRRELGDALAADAEHVADLGGTDESSLPWHVHACRGLMHHARTVDAGRPIRRSLIDQRRY